MHDWELEIMPDVAGAVQRFLEQLQTEQTPSLQRIIQSMDAVAWLLVVMMAGALVVGVVLTMSTRRSFLKPDEVESSPTVLLGPGKARSHTASAAFHYQQAGRRVHIGTA